MDIPKYVPIGYAKGFCKDTKEWVYGWHWTKNPYQCIDTGEKIKHYIRVQHNMDWNLTRQDDYEVEGVGLYIGRKDKDNIPLFLADLVVVTIDEIDYEGYIVYNALDCKYMIQTNEIGTIDFDNNIIIKWIGNRYKD